MPTQVQVKPQILSRRKLQVPYWDEDLLWVSQFIKHCKDLGVRTDRQELEYLDEHNLLLPAIRIKRGVMRFRKIKADFGKYEENKNGKTQQVWIPDVQEVLVFPRSLRKRNKKYYFIQESPKREIECLEVHPKPFFHYGGISHGDRNWVNYFKQQRAVITPGYHTFKPWSYYSNDTTFTTDKEKISRLSCATYYDRRQVYLLSIIQRRLRAQFGVDQVFWDKQKRERIMEKARKFYDRDFLIGVIHQRTSDYYQFFSIHNELRNFRDAVQDRLDKKAMRDYEEDIDSLATVSVEQPNGSIKKIQLITDQHRQKARQSTLEESSRYFEEIRLSELKPQAEQLLDHINITTAWLRDWRGTLLFNSSLETGVTNPHLVASGLKEHQILKLDLAYQIAADINWFLYAYGDNRVSVRALLGGGLGIRHCEKCRREFEPQRRDQKMCASPNCE